MILIIPCTDLFRMVVTVTIHDDNANGGLIIRAADRQAATQSAIFSNAYSGAWTRQSTLNNLPTITLQKNAPRILEFIIANFHDEWALGSVFCTRWFEYTVCTIL